MCFWETSDSLYTRIYKPKSARAAGGEREILNHLRGSENLAAVVSVFRSVNVKNATGACDKFTDFIITSLNTFIEKDFLVEVETIFYTQNYEGCTDWPKTIIGNIYIFKKKKEIIYNLS